MNWKHTGFRGFLGFFFLLCLSLCYVIPSSTLASNGKYYYLQVGTFKVKENADRLKQKISAHTTRVVVRGAESATLGYAYTVFVGPFATWPEADAVRLPIRKQGILIEDAFVIASSEPFPGSMPVVVTPSPRPVAEPPATTAEPAVTVPAEPPPGEEVTPPEVAREEPPTPAPPPVAEAEPQRDIDIQKTKKTPEPRRIRTGRNLGKGVLGLAYSHVYGEYQTNIESRRSRVNGTITDVPVSSLQGLDFDTTMHRDMLRLRYGVVDRFYLFADVGVAYDESATPRPVFGGGGRFEYVRPFNTGQGEFFFAAQGDFLIGELETEFTSEQGGQWKKESDWYEVTGRLEAGMRFVRWAPYVGGSYSVYHEETERKPLVPVSPVPASLTYLDELNEDTPFGVYGGVDVYVTRKLLFNIDGRYGTFNSLSGSIQYNFK